MICIIKTPLFAKFCIKNGDHITKKYVIAVGVLFLVFRLILSYLQHAQVAHQI